MAECFHRAFTYDRPSRFISTTANFLRKGVAQGERILVVVDQKKAGWIRDGLGSDASGIEFVNFEHSCNPQAAVTRLLLDFLPERVNGRTGARVVLERPTEGLTEPEFRDYLRMEAAANIVYLPYQVSLLCPYDAAMGPELIDLCRQVHPELLEPNGAVQNGRYTDPDRFIRRQTGAVPVPPGAAGLALEKVEDLAGARRFTRSEARSAGLSATRAEDIALAVNELASNALLYGSAPRRLSVFVHHGVLVCDIHDGGVGPDPLLAYLPPRLDRPGGRGLWISHLTCDALEFRSDGDGAHVQAIAVLPG